MRKLKYISGPDLHTKYGKIKAGQVFEVDEDDFQHLSTLPIFELVDEVHVKVPKFKVRKMNEQKKPYISADYLDFDKEKE